MGASHAPRGGQYAGRSGLASALASVSVLAASWQGQVQAAAEASGPAGPDRETWEMIGSARSAIRDSKPLHVTVRVRVTLDRETDLYAYWYTISNEADSDGAIDFFALDPIPLAPSEVISPAHWHGGYGFDSRRAIGWLVVDRGSPPQKGGGQHGASQYAVGPGRTFGEFGLATPVPPETLSFYAGELNDAAYDRESSEAYLGATGQILGPARSFLESRADRMRTWGTMTSSATPGSAAGSMPYFHVSVTADVAEDPVTGFFSYTYSLLNQADSRDTVDIFAVRPIRATLSVASPDHWMSFHGYAGDPRVQLWSVSGEGPPPPGWVDHGNSLYCGMYAPRPAQGVGGFQLVTRIPPDTVEFLVKPWRDIPSIEDENDSHPFWADVVRGKTLGPGQDTTGLGVGTRLGLEGSMTTGGWSETSEHPSLCITLELTYRYDPNAGLYTYTYLLGNAGISRDPIGAFYLRGIRSEPQILSPTEWRSIYSPATDPAAVWWTAPSTATADGGPERDALVPRPGTTVCCFDLVSPLAPDTLRFEVRSARGGDVQDGRTGAVSGWVLGPGK